MKTGQTVRLIQPVIQGVVKARQINPGTDEIEVRVEYTEPDGSVTEAWFPESKLEEVAA